MRLVYLFTAITWYRLSLFKEISKLCSCKIIILNGYNYSNTDYKKIEYAPNLGDLDIVFLSEEESKYKNLVSILDKIEFDSIVLPSMNGLHYLKLTNKLAKYFKPKGKTILYFWEYWPIDKEHANLKRKLIQTVRNFYVKKAAKKIDYFFGPSIYTIAYYLSLNIPSNKIIRVLNSSTVEVQNDMFVTKQDLDIPENAKIILYFGRLESYKGVDELIIAFNKINRDDTYLLICGDNTGYTPSLNCSNIKFMGSIPVKKRHYYFSLADIFVLPNNYNGKIEAFGLTINEAMQYSLPIICTDATGASLDLVINNVNGYVINSKNLIDELYIHINYLLEDDVKRKEFGENSKKIIENYSFENMAKTIVYCAKKHNK